MTVCESRPRIHICCRKWDWRLLEHQEDPVSVNQMPLSLWFVVDIRRVTLDSKGPGSLY